MENKKSKILLVSATQLEVKNLLLSARQINQNLYRVYSTNNFEIDLLITGVGLIAMACNLSAHLVRHNYNLAVNVGIAGSFNKDTPLTSLFEVNEDIIADLGVELGQKFISISQLGLAKEEEIRLASNPSVFTDLFNGLKKVRAISKNTGSGRVSTIAFLERNYRPELESMEGAAFHYVCSNANIPFTQIRSVSNYVGERDKRHWDIKGAVTVLEQFLLKSFIENLKSLLG